MHRQRLLGLDLVRFFAAFLVMAFHLAFWSWAPTISTPKGVTSGIPSFPELASVTWFGWVGVEIFFVISGFVIAYSAVGSDAYSFFWRRFQRLVPPVIICATITFIVVLAIGYQPVEIAISGYVGSLVFSPVGPWIDGVYWTLPIEITFYTVIWLLLSGSGERWIEPAVSIIGLLSAAYWAERAVAKTTHLVSAASVFPPPLGDLLLLNHGMYFALGVMLWLGLMRGWTPQRAILVAIFVFAGLAPIVAETLDKTNSLGVQFPAGSPVVVWLVAVLAIIVFVRADKAIANTLSLNAIAAIRILGLATYPLYLVHDVVGAAVLHYLVEMGVERFVALGVTMGAMIMLSLAIAVFVEAKIRGPLTSLWKRSPAPQVAG